MNNSADQTNSDDLSSNSANGNSQFGSDSESDSKSVNPDDCKPSLITPHPPKTPRPSQSTWKHPKANKIARTAAHDKPDKTVIKLHNRFEALTP